MATPHKATPKQWKELEDRATDREFFFISACVAELRSRIEALEANQPHQQDKWAPEARAAILAVAEWLDTRGQHGCSLWLREEVQRHG